MHKLLDKINGLLDSGQDLCLAYICAKRGTSPRDPGAAMIIVDGNPAGGSIGGGAAEHIVCAEAPAAQNAGVPKIVSLNIRSGQADAVACGGDIDILIDPLKASDDETRAVFKAALEDLNSGGKCRLITSVIAPGHLLVTSDGSVVGSVPGLDGATLPDLGPAAMITAGDTKIFDLPLEPCSALFILGSGHVAGALAPLMATLDFRVVVSDDLPQAANSPAAKAADTFLLRPFDQPFGLKGPRPGDYVVCMARTHQLDRRSLAQVLGRGAAYVGMIGSSRKKQEVYEGLAQDGFDDHTLEQIHCPIGLSIGARTPQEIAVSIAAEIIAARAGMREQKL